MRKLRKNEKRFLIGAVAITVAAVAIAFIVSRDYAVLDTKGTIAEQQRNLLVFATLLSLVVILPVFWLTFHIVRTYRVDAKHKKKVAYDPEFSHSRKLETLWWGIPTAIILVLSVVTWQSTHALDPYKPLESEKRPITIEVIALQWKWLFLYPEQNIATVNYVQFPEDTPVNFKITADAPMNSFWIPQLGGQVYAMNGMTTKLHLMADEQGRFDGSSANLSGEGFASMRFEAHATSEAEFKAWTKVASQTNPPLGQGNYPQLAYPSKNVPPSTYSLTDTQLYDSVIAKYMNHGTEHNAGN